ncbi:MAG: anhydro-N-acetylmuramic acid kinase [Bacteroidetes bacterium HGW-Bacteroidetes-12]|nr:MAG: anhydro-N-acetylmuramic acid kinase [Bacteroidetes bacterium HGW-Bacteroidetes-12]
MKENYNVIGLMSGTSLDGLDIVYATFFYSIENQWSFEIKAAKTVAYSLALKKQLANSKQLSGLDLMLLNNQLGAFFGEEVNQFITENNIQKSRIDFVASHGHTVFHQPEQHLTTQIGSGAVLAATIGLTTISDFRTLDVALGGHGAPLVPIGDKLLFSDYQYCLNIGGIANVSFEHNNQRLAFDVCPANLVLNKLANEQGKSFDDGGGMAKRGKVNERLFHQLNALPFYQQQPPKSLGSEWIEKNIFPLFSSAESSIEDKLCTMIEHIAYQLSLVFKENNKSILITGGGAFNSFLIERIISYTTNKIFVPKDTLVEFKEALIFAFLGVLRLRNEINCLASVTGAKRDNVGGNIYIK